MFRSVFIVFIHCLDMVDSAPSINGSACLIYSTSDTTPADGVHCLQCEDEMIWDFDTGYFGDCVRKFSVVLSFNTQSGHHPGKHC